MLVRKILLTVSVLIIGLSTTGCLGLQSTQDTSAVDGGVFKSVNKGSTWTQKVLVPTVSGRPVSFAGFNVFSFVMDPSDANALYFGSIGTGLLYTYNGAESWLKSSGLGEAVVRDLAIDPENKCLLYATVGNKMFRSQDCTRTWEQVYIDNELAATADAVAVDHFDTNNVFLGVSRGDFIKSANQGESWRTIHRFKDRITRIIIDPNDSRKMYVITGRSGVFKSTDSGFTWQDMNDILKELKLGFNVKDLILVKDEPNSIYLVMDYGILRSPDKGVNWEQIELIPPERKAFINAAVVNPQNTMEMYYVTNTTFNRSIDGGQNWTPINLPTTRTGWKLLIDPVNPKILYMGVRSLK